MAEEIKKVSEIDYEKAFDEMCAEFEARTGYNGKWSAIEFHFSCDPKYKMEKFYNRPCTMQVNWAAIGTVMPNEAAEYGKALIIAAELAENFIYNGYRVYYGD